MKVTRKVSATIELDDEEVGWLEEILAQAKDSTDKNRIFSLLNGSIRGDSFWEDVSNFRENLYVHLAATR